MIALSVFDVNTHIIQNINFSNMPRSFYTMCSIIRIFSHACTILAKQREHHLIIWIIIFNFALFLSSWRWDKNVNFNVIDNYKIILTLELEHKVITVIFAWICFRRQHVFYACKNRLKVMHNIECSQETIIFLTTRVIHLCSQYLQNY